MTMCIVRLYAEAVVSWSIVFIYFCLKVCLFRYASCKWIKCICFKFFILNEKLVCVCVQCSAQLSQWSHHNESAGSDAIFNVASGISWWAVIQWDTRTVFCSNHSIFTLKKEMDKQVRMRQFLEKCQCRLGIMCGSQSMLKDTQLCDGHAGKKE